MRRTSRGGRPAAHLRPGRPPEDGGTGRAPVQAHIADTARGRRPAAALRPGDTPGVARGRAPEYGRVPGFACRTPSAACRTPGAACRTPGAACRTPGAACRTPGAACRTPGAACRTPGAACYFFFPWSLDRSGIWNPGGN
ncbi:hypothetical protein [Actinoallomurus liliacearum]|uniref:hypothetical protein n=1 Tax=Actinoallomurus liliacearum TaxID=1080073 RepID=UPI0031EFF3A9